MPKTIQEQINALLYPTPAHLLLAAAAKEITELEEKLRHFVNIADNALSFYDHLVYTVSWECICKMPADIKLDIVKHKIKKHPEWLKTSEGAAAAAYLSEYVA